MDVGNPHLACVVDGLTPQDLADIDLCGSITFDNTVFPDGVNIELITAPSAGAADAVDAEITMRVHERGVGETRSCGTGVVAAGAAALRFMGRSEGTVLVNVPGGQITVTVDDENTTLRGPSVLVGAGVLNEGWL